MTELSSDKLKWLESLMYERDTFERQIAIRRYELEELAKNTIPKVEGNPSVAVEINKFVMKMDVDPQLNNLVKRKKVIAKSDFCHKLIEATLSKVAFFVALVDIFYKKFAFKSP